MSNYRRRTMLDRNFSGFSDRPLENHNDFQRSNLGIPFLTHVFDRKNYSFSIHIKLEFLLCCLTGLKEFSRYSAFGQWFQDQPKINLEKDQRPCSVEW
jgi:hypothetical protein